MGLAYAEQTPGLDFGVGSLELLNEAGQGISNAARRVLLEEGSQALLLLGGVRRIPGRYWWRGQISRLVRGRYQWPPNSPANGARLALEPVRNEDLVLLLMAGGQDVGALHGLVEVAEDVVDDDDALGGVRRAGHI